MINSLSIIFVLIFVTVGGACFLRFVYYIIGEPVGESGRPDGSKVKTGRILSRYGVFILDKFNNFERRENCRLSFVFDEWYNLQDFNAMTEEEKMRCVHLKNIDLSKRRKTNPFAAAGACPFCFWTWLSVGFWIFGFFALGGFNIFYLIGLIPATVILAKRI